MDIECQKPLEAEVAKPSPSGATEHSPSKPDPEKIWPIGKVLGTLFPFVAGISLLLVFFHFSTTIKPLFAVICVFFSYLTILVRWGKNDRIWHFSNSAIAGTVAFACVVILYNLQQSQKTSDEKRKYKYLIQEEISLNLINILSDAKLQYTQTGTNSLGISLLHIGTLALEEAFRAGLLQTNELKAVLDIIKDARLHNQLIDTYLDMSFRGLNAPPNNLFGLRRQAVGCILGIVNGYTIFKPNGDPNIVQVFTKYWKD